MRTKTILLSAACGLLGGIAAQAQSVYSVNAVGYVNVQLPANQYVQIANPLNTTNNTLDALFPSVPDLTQFFKFNGTSYDIASCIGGAWDPTGITLNPGEGGFIQSPEDYTVTFVGEVMQGDVGIQLKTGYNLVGSKVPQAGDADTLGLTPVLQDLDEVYIFNGTSYDIYSVIGGVWDPKAPAIDVAHSVFVHLYGADVAWPRTFNINN